MESVEVNVKYDGDWDSNQCYIGFKNKIIKFPRLMDFNLFKSVILQSIHLTSYPIGNKKYQSIRFWVEVSHPSSYRTIELKNDVDLEFMFAFLSSDSFSCSIVVKYNYSKESLLNIYEKSLNNSSSRIILSSSHCHIGIYDGSRNFSSPSYHVGTSSNRYKPQYSTPRSDPSHIFSISHTDISKNDDSAHRRISVSPPLKRANIPVNRYSNQLNSNHLDPSNQNDRQNEKGYVFPSLDDVDNDTDLLSPISCFPSLDDIDEDSPTNYDKNEDKDFDSSDEEEAMLYDSDRSQGDFRFIDEVEIRNFDATIGVMVNDLYSSKVLLVKALSLTALKKSFQFQVPRSNKSRIYVECMKEGCPWRIRASRYKHSNAFLVHTVQDKHECGVDFITNDHRQASSEMVAEYMRPHFCVGESKYLSPAGIESTMCSVYSINISYSKARRARDILLYELHGSPEDSYKDIPLFGHILIQKNPGSVFFYETDNLIRFKYCFMALRASLNGFKHCRPIISVDGTFLNNRFEASYSGTNLIVWAEGELRKRCHDGKHMKLVPLDALSCNVITMHKDFVVDLSRSHCSCRQWDLEQMPCVHACAFLCYKNFTISNYVSHSYTKSALMETYSDIVYLIGRRIQWSVPEEFSLSPIILPLDVKRSSGRPKKRRIPSVGEFKVRTKCGRCQSVGHNRKTCHNAIPSSSKHPRRGSTLDNK